METVINILILETEPSDTVAVLDELHRPDLKIGTLEIKRPADVLPKLEMNPPGAILACTREPDHALFELLEHLRESSRTLPVIVITARCEPGQLVELMECGAAAHVRRQNLGELADVIRYTLENPPALAIHAGDRGGPGIGSGGITLPRRAGHLRTSGGPLHLRRLLAHRRCLWRMGAFQRLSPPESKDDHHPRALSRVRERSGRFLRTRPPVAAAALKADHFPSPACLNTTMLNGGSVSAAENGWLCIRCGSA